MKISYEWLKDYVSGIAEPARVAEILTGCGLEVENMASWFSIEGGLKGVVIGEVLTCEKHPGSDHLSLTTVDIGQPDPVKIVCGASNVAAGLKVAVATVGTSLSFNDKEITIQPVRIRGEMSEGMICAEDELGIGPSHDGIMILDRSAVPGTPAKDYFNVKEDTVFEIGLTPNRSDAASHTGVARDLVAVVNCAPMIEKMKPVSFNYPGVDSFKPSGCQPAISVIIEDGEGCSRYSGLVFTHLTVKESPEWLKNRLSAIGLRPINNIVDISNFILMELGQPLHAFDADQIKGNKVIIRKFTEPVKFTTLDQVEREITSQDLMICNALEPMCIAGVFGGLKSGVTSTTTSIFLESACFNPVSIRKTARYHGLQTDASFRFERGADINITVYALKRAASLICELAGGEIASAIVDVYPKPRDPDRVYLSFAHLDRLIGKTLDRMVVKNILFSLGITILSETDSGMDLEIPTNKVDVNREADVIEEILRIYGYNNIEFPSTIHSSISSSPKPDPEKIKNGISDYLCANGFSEIMNNSLTRSTYTDDSQVWHKDHNVKILNPLSRDLDVMRQTLLFGGLETIVYNQNRKLPDCKLFEFGNCYFYEPGKKYHNTLDQYNEELHLSVLMTGKFQKESWNTPKKKVDIYDVIGYVRTILLHAGIEASSLVTGPFENEHFSQGLMYKNEKGTLAMLGALSQSILKRLDIRQEVFYAEINWTNLINSLKPGEQTITELPKFPEVRRDLALELDGHVTYDELEKLAFATEENLLKEVGLFDVYEGDKIESGKKSYALYFILQDKQKTLTDDDIDGTMNRLIKIYHEKLNARVR